MQQFSIVRKGYQPSEVDQAIEALEQKVAQQEKELVDYRAREAELDKIEVQANLKAEAIIASANAMADQRLQQALQELEGIRKDALGLRELIETFQNEYNQLLRQYMLRMRTDEFPALMNRLGALIEQAGGEHLQKEEEE
ncbi:MAG: hypothetical protein IJ315_05110 [Firmicutes bacterium]|nr:hypothetical protein [Bacillota bacterium]